MVEVLKNRMGKEGAESLRKRRETSSGSGEEQCNYRDGSVTWDTPHPTLQGLS